MHGGPTAITMPSGKPKASALGRKGNVGGISTPGRKGMKQGLTMLVKPGPGMTKSVKPANLHRPEGSVHIDAGNLKVARSPKANGAGAPTGGSPSKAVHMGTKITVKGHKGIHVRTRPEPMVRRDAAKVVKPHGA